MKKERYSFSTDSFSVDIISKESKLVIEAMLVDEPQVYSLTMNEDDIKKFTSDFHKSTKSLYVGLQDAFQGRFPNLKASISSKGILYYVIELEIGSQKTPLQFDFKLQPNGEVTSKRLLQKILYLDQKNRRLEEDFRKQINLLREELDALKLKNEDTSIVCSTITQKTDVSSKPSSAGDCMEKLQCL